MKRVLFVAVLVTSVAQASQNENDLVTTWKQISEYRAVSGAKAIASGALGWYACKVAYETFWMFRDEFSSDENFWKVKLPNLLTFGVTTGGMAYVGLYKLWWQHCRNNLKHALSVK